MYISLVLSLICLTSTNFCLFSFPRGDGVTSACTVNDNYFGKETIKDLCGYCSDLEDGRRITQLMGIQAIRSNKLVYFL